ncbi:phosphoglycolate phosphatase [Actinopolyspora xinjiangensis]|uniref:Phosphoglycolate phosphatase n=1 Tax=Actinopolyspora xinjiangensis TaxID=405564 RepID=A0A1H0WYE4_9ACTN|nr:HAD family hydrolase [Actinopolyspora xinjiangensis]SDP95266.1 phosphoglycolate phosphatase [Actinopolyspora xinjiangensis]
MTRAIVFDLDGTLADTPAAIAELLVEVAAEFGVTVTPEQAAKTVGRPLEESFGELLGKREEDSETESAVTRYRELFEQRVIGKKTELLYPSVVEGLRILRDSGAKLAVGTSKITPTAEALLSAMEIRDFFDVVVGHDKVSRGKPNPEMGQRSAYELGVPVQECVYVGDTVSDMQMAREAGMGAVAVTYGVAPRSELNKLNGVTCCDDFMAVVNACDTESAFVS